MISLQFQVSASFKISMQQCLPAGRKMQNTILWKIVSKSFIICNYLYLEKAHYRQQYLLNTGRYFLSYIKYMQSLFHMWVNQNVSCHLLKSEMFRMAHWVSSDGSWHRQLFIRVVFHHILWLLAGAHPKTRLWFASLQPVCFPATVLRLWYTVFEKLVPL